MPVQISVKGQEHNRTYYLKGNESFKIQMNNE